MIFHVTAWPVVGPPRNLHLRLIIHDRQINNYLFTGKELSSPVRRRPAQRTISESGISFVYSVT